VDPVTKSGRRDDDVGATEQIDGGDGFDLFKTFGEDCQNGGHGMKLIGMSGVAHGNLFNGKRAVILGCGYVGAAVAGQAVARGLHVTALTRNAVKAEALRAAGVQAVIVADLASEQWHGQIAGGADFVLNCVSSGGGGVDGYRQSYLAGMTSVVAWLRQRGAAGAAVYTSSTSVYPQGGGARVDESAATGGEERAHVLLATEQLLLAAEVAAASRVVLRLAGIYGPGRHHLLEQVRAGEAAGRAEAHLNLAYRDDIVAAVWAAWSAPAGPRIYNVADDGAATKGEMVAWLAARLALAMPKFTGAPAGGRRSVTPDRIIANDRLKSELGWRPGYPTFREGYEKILSL
jgi:nucleoside-diphosphate-sugar epimerase